MTQSECIFCKIVVGDIPADRVFFNDYVTAFRDLNPQAPVHVLIVPNTHIDNTEALESQHDLSVGALMRSAREVARITGVNESGYRLVVNTGSDANNTVAHLHVHLLGGRQLGWPPG